jgi:hypothetical protein
MSFPPAPLLKITARIREAFDGMFRMAAEGAARLRDRLLLTLEGLPSQKRRLVYIAAAVFVVLFVLIVAGAVQLGRGSRDTISSVGTSVGSGQQRVVIPPGELFYPDEPHYIPGVLLEREQRTSWSAEDAAPYWQDPLKSGEQQWRDNIEMTIDRIMESVP